MIGSLTRHAAVGALLTGMTAMPAFAVETIKAVVIDGYPAKALWVQEFSNFFIPEVDKRLAENGNYEMDWQESYGGSIVKPKGVLEGVKLGLGDIGIVTTIFHSSKLSRLYHIVKSSICILQEGEMFPYCFSINC